MMLLNIKIVLLSVDTKRTQECFLFYYLLALKVRKSVSVTTLHQTYLEFIHQ